MYYDYLEKMIRNDVAQYVPLDNLVNNIKSNEVYQKYSQFLNSFDNHHLDV